MPILRYNLAGDHYGIDGYQSYNLLIDPKLLLD